jgi:hypothetical protein
VNIRISILQEVSSLPDRFCEECGAPLTPNTRFCEECGHPVPAGIEQGSAAPSMPAPLITAGVTPQGPEKILAVLPFASRQKGFMGTEDVSIVFTTHRIVPFPWTSQLKPVLKPIQKQLDKQCYDLERKGGDPAMFLGPLVFDPGTVFPPWEQLYPSLSETPGISLTDIEYIRGEQSDVAHFHEDLLVISSPAGEQQFYVEAGWYSASAASLLPLVWESMGGTAGEEILGIIPTGFEPERDGFGFAYGFTLVVTTGRIIYAFVNDTFADIQIAYMKRFLKETGKDRQQLDEMISEAPPGDAPWQGYLRKPLREIFSEDPINFFIPLQQIRSAMITAGKKNKGDLLVLKLGSHEERLNLDPGFGQLASRVLSPALQGRVALQ